MPVRVCEVSFKDHHGIRHSVEVDAETLYEAVVFAVNAFRNEPWLGNLSRGTPLDVEVRARGTKHTVTLDQVERWLAGSGATPGEQSRKVRLKMLLMTGH